MLQGETVTPHVWKLETKQISKLHHPLFQNKATNGNQELAVK
jgi:hypothetical protein